MERTYESAAELIERATGTDGNLPKWLSAAAQACSTLPYLESALEQSGACHPKPLKACGFAPHASRATLRHSRLTASSLGLQS